MAFVTTLTGQYYYLRTVLFSDILRLRLFTNNRTPSKTDAATDYTEVVYVGYAAKLLTPSDWVIAVDGLTGDYVASFPRQTWNFTSSVTVCGYFITDSGGSQLYHADRFPDAPVTLRSDGGPVKVTPTIGLR